MINNREIKLINSLKRKKNRIEEGLFIVEGEKIVNELINSSLTIKVVYATEDWDSAIDFQKITSKELERISHLSSPNKVLALVEIPKIKPIDEKRTSLIIDTINDPGNLGTIIRTADWFGIQQIICSSNSVDIYNPKTIMASMGSVFRVKIHYKSLTDYLSSSKKPSYGALLKGNSVYETNFENPCNIILGSESHGISEDVLPFIDHKTTIPGSGNAESLNLGISAAIYCSEYYKQNS